METLLWLVLFQAPLGAFDIIYHHEVTERLTWKPGAARELRLHAWRNGIYALVFLTFGWLAWQGLLTWLFAALLLAEIVITLWDFLVEDRTRDLPPSERVTHTVLAIAYGAILALLLPVLLDWAARPTGLAFEFRGWLSWIMTVYAAGCAFWAWRDGIRSAALVRLEGVSRDNPAAALPGRWSLLVTGGTGFVGQRLVRDLIDAGHDLTVLTRDHRKLRGFRGALRGIEALEELPKGLAFDGVIHLAGEPVANGRWTAAKKAKILSSRIEGTRDLVDWIARQKLKPRVLISASAVGYYGHGGTDLFTEASEPRPSYGFEVCSAWEAEAARAETLGVRTCQLRLGIVLDADGGALGQMMLPFELGLGGPVGDGSQGFSWIHRDDLVGLIVHALAKDDLHGAINATAPEAITNRDFAQALGRALGRPAVLAVPAWILKLGMGQMAEELLLGAQSVLPKRALASGYRFRFTEIGAALRAVVGHHEETPATPGRKMEKAEA